MIAFETLLLGIIFGRVPIRVMVAPPVVRVELRLDGAVIRTLDRPPWATDHDFGTSPLPHELTAVGLDASGREVGRVTRWVNLGRERASVAVLLERDPATRQPKAAVVSWNVITAEMPQAASATLDGAPLPVVDPRRIGLPATDPAQPHVLSIEVFFSNQLHARADLAFGGDIVETAESELTAIAVALPAEGTPPEGGELGGPFSVDGSPERPVAVDKGRAEVALVMDRRVQDEITRRKLPTGWSDAGLSTTDKFWGDEDRFFAVDTVPETRRDAGSMTRSLFPHSAPRLLSRIDEFQLLFAISGTFHSGTTGEQDIATAAAAAGAEAAAGNHRRAVVLLLAEVPAAERAARRAPDGPLPSFLDHRGHTFDVAGAKAYVAALDVPLVVWSLTGADAGPLTAAWGPAEDVSTKKRLRAATKRLEARLAAQRIVWFAGRHLPQRITIDEARTDLRLAR